MNGLLCALLVAQAGGPARAADEKASPAPVVAQDPTQDSAADADAGTAAELPEATPKRLRGTLDKSSVTLGEPFHYRIEVAHDAADAYALPATLAEQLSKGSLQLQGEPAVTRESTPEQGARTVFDLTLVVNASLKPEIPGLRLLVQGPSGPRQLTVPAQPVEVQSLVEQEGAENAEHAHHGPKPPEPVYVRSWLWAFLLLAIALLVAAVLAVRRALARRAAEAALPPPPPAAHEVAFRRLKELRLRAPWRSGEGRLAIFQLSEIVRVYLGARLGFGAIDLTSEELVRDLAHRPLPGLDLGEFAGRCQWEDLVKFARLEPTAQECLEAIEHAGVLVEKTQERMVRERHADLAAAAPSAPSGPAAPGAKGPQQAAGGTP